MSTLEGVGGATLGPPMLYDVQPPYVTLLCVLIAFAAAMWWLLKRDPEAEG